VDDIGLGCGPPFHLTEVRENKEERMDFLLQQNYPNPFNPSTRITFSVRDSGLPAGQAGFVSLKVYDLLGREVRTLVNENLQPGSYEVTFSADGLASGVYFYRLTTPTFSQSKPMEVIK
jgi:hypothetical protein